MSWQIEHWPSIPPEFGGMISRKTEEISGIPDADILDDGSFIRTVLPLRDVVLYPSLYTPLFVMEEPTLHAIEIAIQNQETMIGVALLDPEAEDPGVEDFYLVGTEIAVGRLMHLPDGSISIVAQGRRRVEVLEYILEGGTLKARVRPAEEEVPLTTESAALMRAVLTLFDRCAQLDRNIPEEVNIFAVNVEEPGLLADLVVSSLDIPLSDRQMILGTFDPIQRLQQISILLGRELDVLELEDEIHARVQSEMDRSQREHYLREQIKAIQSELGEGDYWAQELDELRARINHLNLPDEAATRAQKEVQRLAQMAPLSPEVAVIRTYLDWLLELPWSESTADTTDFNQVIKTFEEQHHGLKEAKDRILEYIAVRSIAPKKHKQPILCFVGPPGTGKTSLGRSIAYALGRKFVRISLGGIRDEAEIRGHRKTYIGALPGRILQGMRRAGTVNPLFMLDEIDKLGLDFRGDPSSALLEILDPEQNHAFSDHYLEIPYDLSHVMFITTANTLDPIPPALLDRLEVIEFPGYIEEDKIIIAQKFLVPRQLEQNGLGSNGITFTKTALQAMIREYTWEAGVRNLEREIGKICRRVARRRAEGKKGYKRITTNMLAKLLGPGQVPLHEIEPEDSVGAATGLAWTEGGGDILVVEALLVEGKGNIQITGQIGEVMQESAQAALTYVKSMAKPLAIDPEVFEKTDIHIHVPEGSIPKDGPSAGVTMAIALASALTQRPVRRDVGMSGEITLRGRVLPIGGVREKTHAAYRYHLNTIVLPAKNEKDLVDVHRQVKSKLDIRLVNHMDEVLNVALVPAGEELQPERSRKTRQNLFSQRFIHK
jgi:ATP-dependent Lon protease